MSGLDRFYILIEPVKLAHNYEVVLSGSDIFDPFITLEDLNIRINDRDKETMRINTGRGETSFGNVIICPSQSCMLYEVLTVLYRTSFNVNLYSLSVALVFRNMLDQT